MAGSCEGDVALGSASRGISNPWAVGERVPAAGWPARASCVLGKALPPSLGLVASICVPKALGVASAGTFSVPGRLGSMRGELG